MKIRLKSIIGITILSGLIISCNKVECEGASNERRSWMNYEGSCLYEKNVVLYWEENTFNDFVDNDVKQISIYLNQDTIIYKKNVQSYNYNDIVTDKCFDENWINHTILSKERYDFTLNLIVEDQNDSIISSKEIDMDDESCAAIRLQF
jgi:hypothetical protein